ncbi:hypothetical protein BGW38_005527 [Lunasporangiospora selenospora]|uniref:tRNA ligase n=1 Tax=Lunasporangiospora selenospora TaxID=979761 RepID=A0A9P6G2X1_9FUNG|nr:hypothetical protein BGW38_005527 [Lunasporangiospora selenospora]
MVSSLNTMNQLTKQLEQTRIHADEKRVHDTISDLERTDRLIHELVTYADNRIKGASSKRGRNLVHGNLFELDSFGNASPVFISDITPGEGEGEDSTETLKKGGSSEDKVKEDKILSVTSWRMNEFEYSKGTLPSLARGLFTYREDDLKVTAVSLSKPKMEKSKTAQATSTTEAQASSRTEDDDQAHYRILIRGYDKFFNIGEVERTKQDWLEKQTEGPYEVTLKENGCIIFMAGMPPELAGPEGGCVVSSKHFMGALDPKINQSNSKDNDAESKQPAISHSTKGKEWLGRTLAAKGKTLKDFGRWLWSQNLTAVAELCDDSFEEHVLEYPADKAGLYLHGLNYNTADFQTVPSKRVQEVAKEWGFRVTDYVTFNKYEQVMAFADKIRNAGEYDNRAVEGFVVRCTVKQGNLGAGKTHFFKIKYDEPYLMYREWREVTKRLWSIETKKLITEAKSSKTGKAGAGTTETGTPAKIRMKYPLTEKYVEFVLALMKKQPELFVNYNKNQGIIAIRDMFLKEWESKSAKEQDAALTAVAKDGSKASTNNFAAMDFQRTVIIPIATIGCGKTTVSVALNKLFGWTHVCSDDFNHVRKSPGQSFIKEVVRQLKDNIVVIADRNNFEYGHRQRVIDAVRAQYPKTRFVALYWSHDDLPLAMMRDIGIERVKSRGANHQTLTPEHCPDYDIVVQRFLRGFEPLDPLTEPDSNFSVVVESKIGEESLVFVERIVKEFAIPVLGAGGIGNHAVPTPAKIKEAVRYAREDWKPHRVITGEAEKFHKAQQEKQEKRAKTEAEGLTEGAPVPEKSRKSREPKYFGIALENNSVLDFLDEQFAELPKGGRPPASDALGPRTSTEWIQLRDQIAAWRQKNRIGPGHHITLIHITARVDELYSTANGIIIPSSSTLLSSPVLAPEKGVAAPTATATASSSSSSRPLAQTSSATDDIECTAFVDYIVWTNRVMSLRVTHAERNKNGKQPDTMQASLHITVGTVDDKVRPFESNVLLKEWNDKLKHQNSKVESAAGLNEKKSDISYIKLTRPAKFSGKIKGMFY